MKRNGSNCPTERNLHKLSLKNAGRKSLHAWCVKANKNAGIPRGICGKLGRSIPEPILNQVLNTRNDMGNTETTGRLLNEFDLFFDDSAYEFCPPQVHNCPRKCTNCRLWLFFPGPARGLIMTIMTYCQARSKNTQLPYTSQKSTRHTLNDIPEYCHIFQF